MASGIPNNDILKRITTLCEERNWSLYRLSKESEVPYTSLSNMFARNTQPTVHTLGKLCKGFGISMSTFFNTPERKNPNTFVLSDSEKQIIELYRTLNSSYRELLETYLESLSLILKKK